MKTLAAVAATAAEAPVAPVGREVEVAQNALAIWSPPCTWNAVLAELKTNCDLAGGVQVDRRGDVGVVKRRRLLAAAVARVLDRLN